MPGTMTTASRVARHSEELGNAVHGSGNGVGESGGATLVKARVENEYKQPTKHKPRTNLYLLAI